MGNNDGFVPGHFYRTLLMKENLQELWEIMQISVQCCTQGFVMLFQSSYPKSRGYKNQLKESFFLYTEYR